MMLGSYAYKNSGTSVLVKTGPGGIHTVTLAAGTDAATLIVYDNITASGTAIIKLAAATGTSESAVLDVAVGTGIYAALTGTAPYASLSYW